MTTRSKKRKLLRESARSGAAVVASAAQEGPSILLRMHTRHALIGGAFHVERAKREETLRFLPSASTSTAPQDASSWFAPATPRNFHTDAKAGG